MELLGFVLAAVIGLSLGLMGGGGSILTVPVLVYVQASGNGAAARSPSLPRTSTSGATLP